MFRLKCLATTILLAATPLQAQDRAFGQVVDDVGRPLAGVHVAITSQSRPVTEKALERPAAVTDENGRFALGQKVFGRYGGHLVFACAGYATMKTTQSRIPTNATDLGTFTMSKGVTLLGVVSDAAGKPIAGAWVAATDMLIREQGFIAIPRHHLVHHEVIGFTDAKGRYRLSGALPHGVDLCVSKAGYLDGQRFGVGVGDPLNFTLAATAPVTGRVLARDGKPVRGAWVWLQYELHSTLASQYRGGRRTDADGRFRLHRTRPGRFQVRVNGPGQKVRTRSAVLDDAPVDFELTLDAVYEPGKAQGTARQEPTDMAGLRVRAVDADGKVLRAFRATAWGSLDMDTVRRQPPWFLPATVSQMVGTETGTVLVPSRRIDGATQVLLVWAPGHAVFARDLTEEDKAQGARVTLTRESVVSGRVVDARTGQPIAGAMVVGGPPPQRKGARPEGWAHAQREALANMYDGRYSHGGVRTDTAGRFRLDRLPAGKNLILAYAPGRPVPAAREVDLTPATGKTDIEIPMASGAWLEVGVTGAAQLDHRCRLRLGPMDSSGNWTWNSFQDLAGQRPIPADGKVTFTGCTEGKHQLILMLGNPPRLGHPLTIDLAEVDIGKGANRVLVDLAKQGPFRLTGKVTWTGDRPPPHRVILAAETLTGSGTRRDELMLEGARCFLDKEDTFALLVPRRPCHVLAIDSVTGVVFGRSELLAADELERESPIELRCAVRRVKITLDGGVRATPTRLDIRIGPAWPGGVGRMQVREGVGDTNIGLPLAPATREWTLWLPKTPVGFRVVRQGRDLETNRASTVELAVRQEDAAKLAPRITLSVTRDSSPPIREKRGGPTP